MQVQDSPTLAKALTVFARADSDVQKEMNKATRGATSWVRAIVQNKAGGYPLDAAVARTTRVAATRAGVKVVVGGSGRIGDLPMRELVRPIEFGAQRNKRVTYRSAYRGGRAFEVRRHTARQLPWRKPKGRIVYPAVAEIAPQIVSWWVRSIMVVYDDVNQLGRP